MAITSRLLVTRDRGRAVSSRRRTAGVLLTLLAYALALLALAVVAQTALTWAQRRLDDWRYGFPRQVVLEAIVGHRDEATPTLIQAVNLYGQIVVVEFPGGNVTRTAVLAGPQLVGHDAAYVVPRLALRDLDGDGHVDLLLTLKGETVVYLNRNGEFQPPSPETLAEIQKGAQ
jgi:hypothetical protein